ncbi:DUF5661 family protein [Thermodesulfovibrio sp.]|uniref:DUF5661 family protein n=1 Tax=Thermodesulfovibrio sp. TaxID=2067987 RepID=UPI00309DD43F
MRNLLTFLTLSLFILFCLNFTATAGDEDAKKFEQYRRAIKKEFNIDIAKFKERLKGGKADGKKITKYDLNQLLMGIKVELEHTNDRMTALEIATDHLEEFPDYYTRLLKMEEEAEKELKQKK